MPEYIRTGRAEKLPQLLQVHQDGRVYQLSVLHAGQETHPRAGEEPAVHRPREHRHDVYHIVLYTEGENQLLLGGERRALRRRSLVLTAPGQPHSFSRCAPGVVTYREVTFALEHREGPLRLSFGDLLSMYAAMVLSSPVFPLQLEEGPFQRLCALFDALMTGLTAPAERLVWFPIFRTMTAIFGFLIEEVFSTGRPGDEPGRSPLDRARAEIERRYRARLAVKELADGAGLSVGYFTRAFKARFGLSPISYQQRLRIDAARNLLLSTSLLSKEIAWRTGFEDEYFFSKTFKKLAGVSPRAFRKAGRASALS
ncbi:MAG: helix-turn-helix transcriptional regulator [Kiritimatiellae bacterium]|nr:helix-turn-helix transcriptional regulator [Kiritimatiellia bacterium]